MIRHSPEARRILQSWDEGNLYQHNGVASYSRDNVVQYSDRATGNIYNRTTCGRITRYNPNEDEFYFLDKTNHRFEQSDWLPGERIDIERHFDIGDLVRTDYLKRIGRPIKYGIAVATGGALAASASSVLLGAAVMGGVVTNTAAMYKKDLEWDYKRDKCTPECLGEQSLARPRSTRQAPRRRPQESGSASAEDADGRAWVRSPGMG